MGDENPIYTLEDYSKPSHEGYMNTIELPIGNNVVPLRSDTIQLVQNGCSFNGLWSEDPNQHLKDFLKLVDLLDLDGDNRKRTRLRRTVKLRNDILMFQQHHGESLSEAWTRFKDLLQKVPHHGINRTRVRKKKGKTYKVLPRGPVYDAILKKKITKKDDIRGNFEIPCSIGGLKHVNALVDQGSNVNVMPYSTYTKLTDGRPAKTDIRLSLASHSYIYPLGITEDVLVEAVKHIYPMDFMIMDIKENEKRPFILGMPFLTTAKAVIKFDTGTITLRSGKSRKAHLLKDKQILSVGGKRKSRKRQNQDETRQKREAWRSREKSKAVTVNKARKTEENVKRRAKCKLLQSYSRQFQVKGQICNFTKV
nr:hypothetical protein [Tanacetum cinerariifolium]